MNLIIFTNFLKKITEKRRLYKIEQVKVPHYPNTTPTRTAN